MRFFDVKRVFNVFKSFRYLEVYKNWLKEKSNDELPQLIRNISYNFSIDHILKTDFKPMAEEPISVYFEGKTLPKTFMLSCELWRKRPRDVKQLSSDSRVASGFAVVVMSTLLCVTVWLP